jgi:hypothetical protein
MDDGKMIGEEGYALATLQTVVEFLVQSSDDAVRSRAAEPHSPAE